MCRVAAESKILEQGCAIHATGCCYGIAFFEYVLKLPAQGIGCSSFSAAPLKTIQVIATPTVFSVFSAPYLKEPVSRIHAVGPAFVASGRFFIFHKRHALVNTGDQTAGAPRAT